MSGDLTGMPARFEPGARIGSYLLERRLGSGGMGTVYAARHVGLDKPVAIKALAESLASNAESVLRFVREGRAASKIRHPHVVDVTDVGTHEGVPYLVMEYLEGDDLHARLKARGPFGPAEIARVMLPVLDAVASAHELGVVHRDLKPSNVFLARGPHGREIPKVVDFGIAKILERSPDDLGSITHAAAFLGTPFYCSPEQARSSRSADARSDQYSLGVMMFELATAALPVRGSTPLEVLTAIISGNAASLRATRPDVSPALAALVDRAMAHDREARFESVRELGRALLPLADPAPRAQWTPAFDPDAARASMARPALSASPFAPTVSAAVVDPSRAAPAFTAAAKPSVADAQADDAVDTERTPPSKSRSSVWIGLASVLLVALGIGAVTLWWMGRPPPVARVTIAAEPGNATLELDGDDVGTGEAVVELRDDTQRHRLRVSAPGYRARELTFEGSAPPGRIVLVAEPPPPSDTRVEAPPQREPIVPEPIEPATAPTEPAAVDTEHGDTTDEPVVEARPRRRGERNGARAPGRPVSRPLAAQVGLPPERPVVRPLAGQGGSAPSPVVVAPVRTGPAHGANNAPILE